MHPEQAGGTTPLPRAQANQFIRPTPFQREVRLGLVLYGGVSLAVYMNGVANEFFNAVKGRGPYRLLKALTDSDIVVDIVSGTSAGGINGVLLSYALSNDREFEFCGSLWRESGEIETLLRDPATVKPRSLLRGETYFQEQLENVFRRMPPSKQGDAAWESAIEAIDLFVTGTDYDGRETTALDSLGHSIDVKDHRQVFKLKFRADAPSPSSVPIVRRNDLGTDWDASTGRTRASQVDEDRVKALATISRITASFPAAFPPAAVPGDGAPDSMSPGAVGFLREWGQLEATPSRWFLDGGVLNNKPFSTTIRDIYLRTGERRVKRKLFYVDPDPERFGKPREALEPACSDVILAALVGLPGYQSITGDLREIDEHNTRVRRYWELVGLLRSRAGDPSRSKPSSVQNDIYLQARVAGLRDAFLESLFEPAAMTASPEVRLLARQIADELLEQFRALSDTERERIVTELDATYLMRRLFHVTYFLYDQLYQRTAKKDAEHGRTLTLLYALNRQLQVLKVVDWAMTELRGQVQFFGSAAEPQGHWKTVADGFQRTRVVAAQELWAHIRALFAALLEVGDDIGPWLNAAYEKLPITDAQWRNWLPDQATTAIPGPSIAEFRERLGARVRRLSEGARRLGHVFQSAVESNSRTAPQASDSASLLPRLDQATARVIESFFPGSHIVNSTYRDFRDIDASLFPLEYLSDLREKDEIDIVRVSPLDAQLGFSRRDLSEKLAGDAFFHFGGFFKRSWRSNDIMWGRLDTADLLLECLLDTEGIELTSESDEGRPAARARLTGTAKPTAAEWLTSVRALFPRSKAEVHAKIAEWLSLLLSDVDADRRRAREALTVARRREPDGALDVLVRAAQLEIVETTVPEVIKDSVAQSLKWQSFKPILAENAADYERSDVDQLAGAVIKTIADDMLARQGPPGLGGGPDQGWSSFLESPRYRVGSEQIAQDVPTGVLIRIATHTLLLAKNIVFAEVESRIGRRPSGGFRLFGALLSGLLWTVYGISGMAMSQQTRAVVNVAAFLASLMLLAIGSVWAASIWWVQQDGGHVLHPVWLTVFILLPLAVLAVQYVYFRHVVRRHRARANWRLAATVVLGVAIVLSVIGGYRLGHYAWIGTAATTVAAALRSRGPLAFLIAPAALTVLLLLARRLTRAPNP